MLKGKLFSCLTVGLLLSACAPPQVGYSDGQTQVLPEPSAPTTLPLTPGGAYPAPPPTARPQQPYPGETVYPTIDSTQAGLIQETDVAASTATTAALLRTEEAQGTTRPTPGSAATSTPPVAPTITTINSKPDCVSGSDYTRCHDAVLSIDFEYPSSWGEISAALFNRWTAGYGVANRIRWRSAAQLNGGRLRQKTGSGWEPVFFSGC
jgi:hypothetical protein